MSKKVGNKKGNRVTWNHRAAYTIARAMIRGGSDHRIAGQDVDAFLAKHRSIIEGVFPHVPRGFSSIGAAVCKCALYYNKRRAIEFLQNFRSYLFDGENDPVFLFHRWFHSKTRPKKDHLITYGITLRACKAFCEHREITELRISKGPKDIFEWDDNWDISSSNSNQKKPVNPYFPSKKA
jgi:hypothetical protein